jgi:hypothetical protein
MATRVVVIAALTCIVIALAAQSPPPPPPSPTDTSQKQQEVGRDESSPTQAENRPTPFTESTLNQASTEPPAETRKTTGSEYRQKSSLDYNALAVTFFTGVLAFVAWRQLQAMRQQARYMREGLTETKKAADAALKSAEVASKTAALSERNTTVTTRAVVKLDNIVAMPISATNEEYFKYNSLIMATLKNYGSTLAKDVKLTGEMKHPGGSFPFRDIPETTIAPQGESHWITFSLRPSGVKDDIIAAINRDNNIFTFDIRVTYRDVFENPYEYTVTGLYIPLIRSFITTASH